MSSWWMKPDQEETEPASSSHRVAEVLDRVLLVLGPIILVYGFFFVAKQRFDTWDIFVGLYILITWLLRLNAMLKRTGDR